MRNANLLVSTLLMSCVLVLPVHAAGLLGVGGSGGGSGAGVSGVATVSTSGGSSGTQADATVLDGGGSTINADLSGVTGGDSRVTADLPGTSNSTLDGTLGDVATTSNGAAGNGGTVDTLLTDSGLSGNTGGLGGALGSSGGLLGGNGGAGGAGGAGGIGALGIAGAGGAGGVVTFGSGNAACRQDTRSLVRLLQMHYDSHNLSQWSRAAGVQVVKVPVCPQIRGTVARNAASNAGIEMMRGVAARDPLVSTSLGRAGVKSDNVLGVAQANGNLTVYVY